MSATGRADPPSTRATAARARRVGDGLLVTWRNLKRIPRIPELAIFAILQSIMFVLLFAFVFGGAIPIPGYAGSERLPRVPDARASSPRRSCSPRRPRRSAWPTTSHKGIIDRFRSLPMARSAVLTGRTLSRRRLQRRHPDRPDAVRAGRRLDRPHRAPGRCWPASRCCCCSPSRCPGSASGWGCTCRPSRSPSR